MIDQARSFLTDQRGNIAIMTAFLLPTTILGIGVAVDYSTIYLAKTELQQMADASVIAAAREMVLINKTSGSAAAVTKNFVVAHMKTGKSKFGRITNISVKTDTKNNYLTVSITASRKNAFGGFLQPVYTVLKATAKAKALAGVNICAIGLDAADKATIKMDDNAALVGNACAVYSNSTATNSIELLKTTKLQAGLVCSAGGIKKTGRSNATNLVTDCPPIENPLQARPALSVGRCNHTNYVIENKFKSLWPGTYCGGLKIRGRSVVKFKPGTYIIKDGPLEISGRSVARGKYSGFYFTGAGSRMEFGPDTTIRFVAPRSGIMAGMLFYQNPVGPPPSDDDSNNPRADKTGRFDILSNDAHTLLGTIYLPRGKLFIKSNTPVADQSAFTVVIAKRMQFYGNSKLVLNSDYGATDVPVPEGVLGQNAKIYLTK